MEISKPALNYINDLPFEAELCRIGKQLPHRHSTELELVYCLKGSIHLIASDQDFVISEGQLHSIDFGDIHYLNGEEDNLTLIFHIDLSAMPNWEDLRYVFFACESIHCYPYQQPAMERVKDIILSLSYIYFTGNHISADECFKPLHELIDTLFTYFNWFNYENQDEYMNRDLYDRFTRVLAYIVDNYRQKITVSQLAAMEHMNKNYFSQFISKTVFSSFSNMVKYIRCYQAETLLLTTDRSIAGISYDCGFSDPKYFYAAFKDLWHLTPTEDRERYRRQYEEAILEQNASKSLPAPEAADTIRDYITKWHLAKTFR
ncbi:MAG: helix-turn-helix domain-containing protein [Bacillota bacterium]|nr:helix-turn-helix domain-containing protein [Bacillota bacterium]